MAVLGRAVPREYHWRTLVWQAHLDAFREMRCSALLQLLQEAATGASADAGFDPEYYERQGTQWVVRRTSVNILAPLRSGQEVHVRTWVADFRRVRSYREYEISLGTRVVAHGQSDWIYVDRLHGRPRRIPDDMQRAFLPQETTFARHPAPRWTAAGTGATVTTRLVEYHELDALQHVNNAAYADYVEEAALRACEARGWPLARHLAAGGRFRPVAHDLEYLDAAFYDERLSIATWPLEVSPTALALGTAITCEPDGRPILRARSRYDWVDAHHGDPIVIPAALRRALAP